MDGVLVDSYEAWHHIVNDALVSIGRKPLSWSYSRRHFGSAVEKDQKTIFKGYSIPQIRELYLKQYFRHVRKVKLFPETKSILDEVSGNGWGIALISNSTKKIVEPILNRHRISHYFDAVVTMDDVKRRKPHPEMVVKACKQLKVKPSEAVVIGDTQNDMIAGKRAGCTTIGIKTKGEYTVRRLSSITRFL